MHRSPTRAISLCSRLTRPHCYWSQDSKGKHTVFVCQRIKLMVFPESRIYYNAVYIWFDSVSVIETFFSTNEQGCRAVTFLVGSGSGSGSGEAIRLRLRLRLRVKLFCGSGSSSGSGQNVPAPAAPAPAPAPMIKSSYFQKCQMSKYDFLLTWP